jgi:CDP-diacylglycerol---glycerol-3-phosphate 3-phosphatidyltransferase
LNFISILRWWKLHKGGRVASVYDLKPQFQQLLRPAATALVARGFTANQVTLAAVGLSLAGGLLLTLWPGRVLPLLLVPVVLFARMALNALDGLMAREHGQASRLGALLNELGDVASDVVLYMPLALLPGLCAVMGVAAPAFGIAAEVVGLAALSIGAPRGYQGPMGKSDRAVAFSLLAVLAALGVDGFWLNMLVLAIVLLGMWTIIKRIRAALDAAPKMPVR